ncbi:hypothetical protein A2U01_0099860, partial [Trifolium medium]|nr:hypothetical protein [Trifolium medium]
MNATGSVSSKENYDHQQNKGKPVGLNKFADHTLDENVSLCLCPDWDSESDTEQDHPQDRHVDDK